MEQSGPISAVQNLMGRVIRVRMADGRIVEGELQVFVYFSMKSFQVIDIAC